VFEDLATLRRRRSSKWVEHPADVLPAFVAEMDVALAPPVRDALIEAIELGDVGYAEPGGLFEAFAGFAARRFGWTPDTDRMALLADVMSGIVELLRYLTAPGDGVVITPPIYPPFFEGIPEAGRRVVEVPLAGGRSRPRRARRGVRRHSCCATRTTPPAACSSARASRRSPSSPSATARS